MLVCKPSLLYVLYCKVSDVKEYKEYFLKLVQYMYRYLNQNLN